MPIQQDSDLILSTLLETGSEAVLILNAHGGFMAVSAGARLLLGASPEAGQSLTEFLLEEDREPAQAALHACVVSGLPLSLTLRTGPGAVPASWVFKRCGEGCLLGVSRGNAWDTGVRHEFLAFMGHELRSPLTSLLALTEAMQDQIYGPVNEAQKRALRSMHDSVQRELELINDIVDLGRADRGMLKLVPAECPLDEVVGRAVAMVSEYARSRSIKVQHEVSPAGGTVFADPRRLKQIMASLLNAVAGSTPVGSSIRLAVRPLPEQGRLSIMACGEMSALAADSSDALKKLVRLAPAGFTLMHRLVGLHNGRFEIMAAPEGGGACLVVELPLAWVPGREKQEVLPGQPQAAPGAEAGVGAPLILLVDDQITLLSVVCDYLTHKGMRIRTASNGQDALDLAELLQPSLVIMDVQMPGMDGLEALRRLRQSSTPAVAAVPVISLSGLTTPEDRERCMAAGASDYLTKPFGVEEIDAAVQKLLG